ncbi:MAG: hypothetical protein ACT4TC_26420 [Myxococcaceae bacterium]
MGGKGWLLACFGVLSGCPAPAPTEVPSLTGGPASVWDSGLVRSEVDGGTRPLLQLTPEKLAAYLRYQTVALELSEGVAKAPAARARGTLRARALKEQGAREVNGLTEAEVEGIDELVHAVIPKRVMWGATDYDGLLTQHEKLLESVPIEARPSVQRQMEQLRETREDLRDVAEERVRFGTDNVTVLLTQEKALVRNWNRMVQMWSGAK